MEEHLDIWYLIPYTWCRVPGTIQSQNFIFQDEIPTWHLDLVGYMVPGSWYVVRSTWYQIAATW